MNEIFNFRRFGKYFATDVKTCWANYGLSLITISCIVPMALYIGLTTLNLIMTSSWNGPDMGFRVFAFCVAIFCIIVTMPVKCYGKITEKQYGSFWLTLPASRLEKFLSMFLMTCIIVPSAGMAIYLGMDALICAFDHTCGDNLIAGGVELIRKMGDLQELTMNLVDESITIEDAALAQEIINQINSPLLYIDEIFGITLPFLLGAVYFKNGKTAKTILAIFAFTTLFSIAATPVMESWTSEIMNGLKDDTTVIRNMFDNGLFKNLVLIDTISDTVLNLALMAGVWFRIKTLKH